ncbi:MAG: TolC family protein [Bacteroidota bacterium]|nr:TolC family protein [Bacteroidota bacterium]
MKKLKKNSIAVVLILYSYAYLAQTPNFTYNSFIISVKQNNPLAKRAENNSEYAKAQLTAAKGNFDPQLNSYIDNKQFNSGNYFTVAGAELKQQLYTSQYIRMGYQYGQGIYLNPENTVPLVGLPYVGIEASILRGLMFDSKRAEVIKAKHYSEFYKSEQNIQLNDLLFVASNTYFDVLYTKKVNKLFAYFADLANQRLKGITELSLIGERPIVDTVEAAIFLQSRLLDLQSGEIEMIKKFNELLILDPVSNKSFTGGYFVSDSLDKIYGLVQTSIKKIVANDEVTNPMITQYMAKQKVLETEAKLKKEMIKPVLDVSYNFLNTNSNIIFPTFNTNNYKWGATFSFPLFLRKPRHEYKMASITAKNNELELFNKQNQLTYKRKLLIEALQVTSLQIANAERSSNYSKILVEAERLKFVNGESSLFLLNSRENKWLETELKLAEYKLKFLKGFIELVYVNGNMKYEL